MRIVAGESAIVCACVCVRVDSWALDLSRELTADHLLLLGHECQLDAHPDLGVRGLDGEGDLECLAGSRFCWTLESPVAARFRRLQGEGDLDDSDHACQLDRRRVDRQICACMTGRECVSENHRMASEEEGCSVSLASLRSFRPKDSGSEGRRRKKRGSASPKPLTSCELGSQGDVLSRHEGTRGVAGAASRDRDLQILSLGSTVTEGDSLDGSRTDEAGDDGDDEGLHHVARIARGRL